MNPSLQQETEDLRFAWSSKTPEKLKSYLVSGTQDPRLNVQSALTRHFLVRQMFGARFAALEAEELLHAVQLNTLRVLETPASEARLNAFQERWRAALAGEQAPALSVLEAACGSANDYRYFDAYGIARFLDYSGFDLSEANVANARAMFPGVDFQCGNVFQIPRATASVDIVVAFDLFEHLSPEGMERALAELCRVARRGLALGLFNAAHIDAHEFKPVPERRYYWSRLSLERFTSALAAFGFTVDVVHIRSMLTDKFRAQRDYDAYLEKVNPNLFNVFATR